MKRSILTQDYSFLDNSYPRLPRIKIIATPVQNPSNNISRVNIFGDMTQTSKRAWDDIVESAERHNDPGTFTSLIGWEWSSIPMGSQFTSHCYNSRWCR